jgi:hypothetical protein
MFLTCKVFAGLVSDAARTSTTSMFVVLKFFGFLLNFGLKTTQQQLSGPAAATAALASF